MANEELKLEIKQLVIDALRLEDVKPEDLSDTDPLFGNEDLGLDSVDAVELVVAIQRRYGARIADQNLARDVLSSIETIAAFVAASRPSP
jgi:acyl carrier protein